MLAKGTIQQTPSVRAAAEEVGVAAVHCGIRLVEKMHSDPPSPREARHGLFSKKAPPCMHFAARAPGQGMPVIQVKAVIT